MYGTEQLSGIARFVLGSFRASPPPSPSPLLERLLHRQAIAETKLAEVLATTLNFVDPDEAFVDPVDGERWLEIGVDKSTKTPYDNETALATLRTKCRKLALKNEFAINGHENRISYVVGSGHKYTVTLKAESPLAKEIASHPVGSDEATEARKAAAEKVSEVQAEIDDFRKRNKWHKRQQEIVRRKDRDGECFLRFFEDEENQVVVRFVEPGQVATPDKVNDPSMRMGIITDPDDVEDVKGYYIDGRVVDAAEIQHRKLGVDSNVRRGIPLFDAVTGLLQQIETIQKNMSVVTAIQSAISMIRKHLNATVAGVNAMVQDNADQSVSNSATGTTTHYRQYGAGTVIDAPAGTEYSFPSHETRPDAFVVVIAILLRGVASRLVMPEFMLTSDASNSNYSSTMVAEGPAVKFFERLQWDMIEDDREVLWRVLDAAVAAGRLDMEIVAQIEITAHPPRIVTRDRDKEVRADVQLVVAEIISRHEARLRHDVDPFEQEAQIALEKERNDPYANLEFPQAKGNAFETPADREEEEEAA